MIAVTVNAGEARARLDASAVACRDLSPAMKAVATRLYQDVSENFEKGGAFPAPWQPSMRVVRRGGQTLVDKGLLRRSFSAGRRWGADFAEVGSNVKYAAIHQWGGIIRQASRGQMVKDNRFIGEKRALGKVNRKSVGMRIIGARAITMPARPMLPVDAAGNLRPETERYVRLTIERHLLGQGQDRPPA
jgi:phage gpG-like protein